MNIQKGYLYFIKDLYFDKVQDNEHLYHYVGEVENDLIR